MWRRDRNPGGRELVADCEAFMEGRYVEHLIAENASVPAWAWTNLLAHGTEEQLRCPPTDFRPHAPNELKAWYHARSYLAGEVLDLANGHRPLRAVQAEVLVPLESALATPSASRWRPADWVGAVLAAVGPLTGWRPTRRRS